MRIVLSSFRLLVACSALLGLSASDGVASSFIASRMVEPEEVGMSSQKLEEIGDFLEGHVDGKQLGGAIVLVAKDGKVVSLESVGMRSVEKGIPMSLDTLFRIASMTKPIVSAVIMTLYDEGRFSLDDPISKWLPEFKEMRVVTGEPSDSDPSGYVTEPARRQITIRHLLTHTAGFPQNGFDGRSPRKDWLASDAYRLREYLRPYGTLEQMAEGMAKLPLNFHPGEARKYGPSTDVLARLTEVISGQPLDAFLAERIFQPLGMKDTAFFITPKKAFRLASIYEKQSNGRLALVEDKMSTWNVGTDKSYFSAQGGLVSTVEDYFRFMLMIQNEGVLDGVRVLKSETVRLMGEDHIAKLEIAPGANGFGLGFGVSTSDSDSKAKGRLYWFGSEGTGFFVDPGNDLVFVLMVQKRNPPYLRIPIEAIIYEALQLD